MKFFVFCFVFYQKTQHTHFTGLGSENLPQTFSGHMKQSKKTVQKTGEIVKKKKNLSEKKKQNTSD